MESSEQSQQSGTTDQAAANAEAVGIQSLAELLQTVSASSKKKGGIYLSPLKDSPKKRELLPRFKQIKAQSQLPVYAYLIQRL